MQVRMSVFMCSSRPYVSSVHQFPSRHTGGLRLMSARDSQILVICSTENVSPIPYISFPAAASPALPGTVGFASLPALRYQDISLVPLTARVVGMLWVVVTGEPNRTWAAGSFPVVIPERRSGSRGAAPKESPKQQEL